MTTRLKLKPGSKGTKKLLQQYGDALVCVRYRYNAVSQKRIKTVELIVEKKTLVKPRFRDQDIVPISLPFEETALKEQVRKMHAKWDPTLKD